MTVNDLLSATKPLEHFHRMSEENISPSSKNSSVQKSTTCTTALVKVFVFPFFTVEKSRKISRLFYTSNPISSKRLLV